ncbi:methyltransferase domain-containing protein [Loigolactobacillus binensis]|uniref:Class I SAM-dependent methyltransferase n=1 Tax=Loigolactobacillus binensis TaxID=2559922 RepID=A0ABW3ECD7_9LACO|nr:methyltransferase domain-containing protein [Loigolactobacillus binensis]
MEWNAQQYEDQHSFVFKYGAGLLPLISTDATTILDVGCGTGDLTDQLRQQGYTVKGIDQSANMIKTAQQLYPQTDFAVADILALPTSQHYDVIFSNAVFHWITQQDQLLAQVAQLLNPHGKLICEFGAQGNIQAISDAFSQQLAKLGVSYRSPFFFPSPTAYKKRLLQHGFQVEQIVAYPRPTTLSAGLAGLSDWVKQFFAADLAKLSVQQQATVLANMTQELTPKLWRTDHWEADYRRLRVVATHS